MRISEPVFIVIFVNMTDTHRPEFDQRLYVTNITEHAAHGTKIASVSAHDQDTVSISSLSNMYKISTNDQTKADARCSDTVTVALNEQFAN